ncbi:MAG: DUF1501 domain-containing protein [Ferruginibacter sp.]|nr:DUF1501 domain-containing protein [Ferruginibacter sp.]
MLIKRRKFLQVGSLASTSLFMPKFLKAFESRALVPSGNKVLVVIQFSGGNDGLNTVIPITNDIYYRGRPVLGIDGSKAEKLETDFALHPELTHLKSLYGEGYLGILNGVGYPNPNRSHFRSMDIWQSGSHSQQYLSTGWLGRYLDAQCSGCDKPTQALEIDDILSLALKGEDEKGIAFKNPKRLFSGSNENYFKAISKSHEPTEETIDYLYKVMGNTLSSAEYIYNESMIHPTGAVYPNSNTGKALKTISSLILSDINTSVYYLSLGSFDTHINQAAQQTRLFKELNAAIASFTDDLKKNGRFNDVLIMTFSEFGRRVNQNASNGTDHGTANSMFFISGALKQKGLLNPLPDLENLDSGDLRYTIDFKSVYATVLRNWLGADDRKVLGEQFPLLSFI